MSAAFSGLFWAELCFFLQAAHTNRVILWQWKPPQQSQKMAPFSSMRLLFSLMRNKAIVVICQAQAFRRLSGEALKI